MEVRTILPSAIVLTVMAAVALLLTITRGFLGSDSRRIRGAVIAAVLALLIQAAHFSEELLTGFHQQFPELFGLSAMPLPFFVLVNLFWLAVWSVSIIGLGAGWRVALFPLWFLGIGCAVNGIAHPSLALLAGGYFPGLVSSLPAGAAGVLLLVRLASVTESPPARRRRLSAGVCDGPVDIY